MKNLRIAELRNWYGEERPTYQALVESVRLILASLLDAKAIPYVGVQGRCKSTDSFREKIRRKRYKNPKEEMTDLAGLRIITLVESDIKKIENVIRSSFEVFDVSSVDKSLELGVDKFGYRSVHLVCGLGDNRTSLPEHARFCGLRFEVQIRTSLQHAWAEIEHDRGYKLKGDLPSHLKRRFALLAGLLELADSQFDQLTIDVDKYQAEISTKAAKGELDIEINSSSVHKLLTLKFGSEVGVVSDSSWVEIINEVKGFGINDLRSLSDLFTQEICALARTSTPDLNPLGLIRDSLMLTDIYKYFKNCWDGHWHAIDSTSDMIISRKYGKSLDDFWERHGIDVYPDEVLSDDNF